jgi:hypothetical protein
MMPAKVREPVEAQRAGQVEALCRMVEGQAQQIRALSEQVEKLGRGQEHLRADWLKARDELWSRQDELQAELYAQQADLAAQVSDSKLAGYRLMIRRLRELIRNDLPRDATMLVVSKGDQNLLDLYGRRAMHFPQTAVGVYAGAHPANSAAAIIHLEALRAKGAEFLIFPATAHWWLDHYGGLKQHLERHYRLVLRQVDTATIFSLREPPQSGVARALAQFEQILAEFEGRFDREPAVLDWQSDLSLATEFPYRAVFSPPAGGAQLPHLDNSVDIVVAPARPDLMAEAARVSAAAVVGVAESGLQV